jgi:hypothetical protein
MNRGERIWSLVFTAEWQMAGLVTLDILIPILLIRIVAALTLVLPMRDPREMLRHQVVLRLRSWPASASRHASANQPRFL